MRITKVVIQAEQRGIGEIEILAIDGGAKVVHVVDRPGVEMKRETLGVMKANDEGETRRLLAVKTAAAIYGVIKGAPNATGSMVYSVRCEIERVAGC